MQRSSKAGAVSYVLLNQTIYRLCAKAMPVQKGKAKDAEAVCDVKRSCKSLA